MPSNPAQSRIQTFQRQLKPFQTVLLSHPADITYFTGFNILVPQEREAFTVITATNAYLFHDAFSPVKPTSYLKLLKGSHVTKLKENVEEIRKSEPFETLIIDPQTLFVAEMRELEKINDLKIDTLDRQWVWNVRSVKDAQEIAAIHKASHISAQAFEQTVPQLRAGMTEIEVKKILETEMKHLGADLTAFPTIIAFGENSALPHHQPTGRQLKKNMPILFDFGAKYEGYCSDMTRTIWFGDHPSELFKKIESVVMQAYSAVLEVLQNPIDHETTAKDLDDAARDVITKAGYSGQFIHTTGHGLGLEIHEQPSLNWKNTLAINPGMTITVEPGIYLEGALGFRYENTLVVRENGCNELTLWT